MKKLLHLLAGLLFAVLPSKAQNGYTVDPNSVINNPTALKSGEYLIYCEASGKTPGFLFYKNDDNSRPFRFNNGISIAAGYVSNAYYVWTVTEVVENGKTLYTFTNKQDNSKYLLKDNMWNRNMAISADKEIAKLEAVPYTDEIGVKTIALKLPEQITPPEGEANADPYIFCNTAGDPNLSYWGSDNPKGAVHFTFYPVSETSSPAPEYPFLLSDAPKDGQFAEKTYWYFLKLNNKYATYKEGSTSIPLTSTNPVNYGSFWAFVENGDGTLTIYNAATGTSKFFAAAANPNTSGTSYPNLMEKATGVTTTWEYVPVSNSDTQFCLNLTGETNKYPNDYAGNGSIAFWNATGEGSTFIVEYVNLESTIAAIRTNQEAITGAVGTLASESYANFTAALDKGTMEGLVEALKIRDLTGTTIQFDASKYYRLQNVKFGGIFGINPESMSLKKETAMDPSNANLLFKFEEGANGKVKIYHPNAKLYIGTAGSGESVPLKEESEASEYTKLDWGTGNFGFMDASNLDIVQFGKNGNIGLYRNSDGAGKGGDHAWYLIPAEEIDVNITAAGYATVNYPFAVQLPENSSLKAYTGEIQEGTDGKVLLLTEVPEGKIPAETPVVLEGAQGNYTLTIDSENTEPSIPSALAGTLLPKTIEEGTTVYGLGYVKDVIGFYKMNDTNRTIGANKAYLPSSPVLQGVRGVTFSFGDNSGETTGIEDVTSNLAKEEYYDLQGRRVMNPTEGIYVTKSGKKVLFTK